jgi:hypothetical protein
MELWGYTGLGVNPVTIGVETGVPVANQRWTGETDSSGHPVISCVMPDPMDQRSATRVIRDAVLTALTAWGVPEERPVFGGLRAIEARRW